MQCNGTPPTRQSLSSGAAERATDRPTPSSIKTDWMGWTRLGTGSVGFRFESIGLATRWCALHHPIGLLDHARQPTTSASIRPSIHLPSVSKFIPSTKARSQLLKIILDYWWHCNLVSSVILCPPACPSLLRNVTRCVSGNELQVSIDFLTRVSRSVVEINSWSFSAFYLHFKWLRHGCNLLI